MTAPILRPETAAGRGQAVATRRSALFGAAALGLLAACDAGGGGARVRIGHQRNGLLLLAKHSGRIDDALAMPPPAEVTWLEFSSGPPLLEALGVGSIDFGSTGDAPPIFAQAAGAPLLYVGAVRLSGRAGGVLTPAGSDIQGIADLKGRRLAFTRGSSAHNSAAALLEEAGLTLDDVTEVHLTPADAAAAFTQGGIDAWVIWDPYYTIALQTQEARVLTPGSALPPSAAFFLAHRDFAEAQPDVLRRTLDALAEESRWADGHRGEVAALFAQEIGLPLALMQDTVERDDFALVPVGAEIAAAQQAIADRFARLGLIPAPISIADAVWDGWAGQG
jgi:sulfonate transport system substrate-binding protein